MNQDNRNKIIEKIKKLLALADDNCNESEALEAALASQRLIAQYNIDESELATSSNEIEEVASKPYSGNTWRYILANIIAENFRCKSYTSECANYDNSTNKYEQVFIGYSNDAQAALLVYEKLVTVGENQSKTMSKLAKEKFGTSKGVKNTFLLGFCYGVKLELEKQAHALMLVTPAIVKSKFDDMNLGKKDGLYLDKRSLDYSEEGIHAGKEAIQSGMLPEKTA